MERLTDAVELLDGPLDDPATLEGNLRDLRRINRRLGGVALSAAAIEALAAHRGELTLLDVGTGGADIPAALIELARRRRRRLQVVGLDSRPEILAAARRTRPGAATIDGLELHVGDGRDLRYATRSFDVAHASLVVHHLEPPAAIELLREMGRVARLGVVVNDLDRSRTGWVAAWLLGHLLTANRYTRHDAPLSVRRAYRADEMAALLRAAGLLPVRTIRGAAGQRYAIAAVKPTQVAGDDGNGPPDPAGAGE
jgi:ubiquinone/menaquinone biosynthesis C-methylase UbiE